MKRITITLLCLLAHICVIGQTPTPIEYYKPTGASSGYTNAPLTDYWYKNLEKYWYYRYRLVNDFTYIGTNPGESIIASRRTKGDSQDPTARNLLDFAADQTIDLGTYMAVLATEFEQLVVPDVPKGIGN